MARRSRELRSHRTWNPKKAKKQNRLSTLWVALTDEKAQLLLDFMDAWIKYGSYKHYAGNQNMKEGTGSGCADFATFFLQLALDGKLPANGWKKEIILPWRLLQDSPGRKHRNVSIWEMSTTHDSWGKSFSDGILFSINDPETLYRWVVAKSPGLKEVHIVHSENPKALAEFFDIEHFRSPYPLESESTVRAKWKSIGVFR